MTPYTHYDKDNEFPVNVIFTGNSGPRFTKNKIYYLDKCTLKQSTNCTVIDDNGVLITFSKGNYWKLLSEIRNEKLDLLLK